MGETRLATSMNLRRVEQRFPRLLLLTVVLLASPCAAKAANKCAWMNEATASGLLGGEAVVEVTPASASQPAICTFTQQETGVKRTLRVTVEIAADPHGRFSEAARSCGNDATVMKAIGNEALFCSADDRKVGVGERAVGRVRDQVFTITISSSQKNDSMLTRSSLESRIYTAAEQVAGILF